MSENVTLHRVDLLEVLRCAEHELRELGAVGGPFSTLEKVTETIACVENASNPEPGVKERVLRAVFAQLDMKAAQKVAVGTWHRNTAAEMLQAFVNCAEAMRVALAPEHLPQVAGEPLPDALFEFEMSPSMWRARLEQHAAQRETLTFALARLVAAVQGTLERQSTEVVLAARDAGGVLAGQGDLLAGKAVRP